jgi:hypothetical protein
MVGVRLAGKQRFELEPSQFRFNALEGGFRFGDRFLVFFGFAELDQREMIIEVLLHAADRGKLVFKRIALAHHALGAGLIVPKVGVFGFLVQFGQTPLRGIDVKDASSAIRATA